MRIPITMKSSIIKLIKSFDCLMTTISWSLELIGLNDPEDI